MAKKPAFVRVKPDIHEHPGVAQIATQLGIDLNTVVGCLVKIWSWAATYSNYMNSVGADFVDRTVGQPGFAEAMHAVGWLGLKDNSILIIQWDKVDVPFQNPEALLESENATASTEEIETESNSKTTEENRKQIERSEFFDGEILSSDKSSESCSQPESCEPYKGDGSAPTANWEGDKEQDSECVANSCDEIS